MHTKQACETFSLQEKIAPQLWITFQLRERADGRIRLRKALSMKDLTLMITSNEASIRLLLEILVMRRSSSMPKMIIVHFLMVANSCIIQKNCLKDLGQLAISLKVVYGSQSIKTKSTSMELTWLLRQKKIWTWCSMTSIIQQIRRFRKRLSETCYVVKRLIEAQAAS